MGFIEICISFQVAILGISTPILLQAITNLDNKYGSLNIINLFKKEISYNFFVVVLISSLVITASYLTVNIYFDTSKNNALIIHHFLSGSIPVVTAILVVVFLSLINRVLIYYTPDSLFSYLWKRDVTKNNIFPSFVDVFHFIIQAKIDKQAWKATKEIFKIFRAEQEDSDDRIVRYPDHYYEFVEKTVDKLIKIDSRWFTFLDYRTAGGIWYLGQKDKYGIHDQTYRSLWRIMVSTLDNNRQDMAFHLWQNLHHYSMFDIRSIQPEYDFENFEEGPTNKEEILKREKERERLFEFATALGGLAMYLQNYSMIRYMFNYTNSEPPDYELLPSTMDEIFHHYIYFRNSYREGYHKTLQRYYFPNIDGMRGEKILIDWICRYIALLFLRQYTIRPYLTFHKPLELPVVPESQSDKKIWLEHLESFKRQIRKVLNNVELKEAIGFEQIDDNWFETNEKDNPEDFFNKLKEKLDEAYEEREVEQDLSEEKIRQFEESTGEIITEAINKIVEITNEYQVDEGSNYNSWYTRDLTSVLDRSAFLDDVDAPNINFDTFSANEQSRWIKQTVTETFHLAKTKSYVLNSEDIFKPIEKLQEQLDPEDLVMVNAGIFLPYLKNTLQIEGLSQSSYRGTEIIELNTFTRLAGRSIYVMKKSDLPHIKFHEPKEEIIDKFGLNQIGDHDYNIFASVTDLLRNEDLRNELQNSTDKDLSKSVYIYIYNRIEILFNKKSKIFELTQYEANRDKGEAHDISKVDIKLG